MLLVMLEVQLLTIMMHAAGGYGGARQCPLKQQQQLLPSIADDDSSNAATITGTAIIEMQPGQKVSDSLLFHVA